MQISSIRLIFFNGFFIQMMLTSIWQNLSLNFLKTKISLGNLASSCKMILEFIWAISSLENSQCQNCIVFQLKFNWNLGSVQFSHSVSPTLCDPMDCSMPGLTVHHQLPEFTQINVHWVGEASLPSHPLSSPSPPAPNPSQHQGLFQWVNSWHEVAEVLEFQLQHQSFQWTPRTDLL